MVAMASSATSNIPSAPLLPDTPTPNPPKKASENRRSNKPIMEKRRRARINNSLNDLKALILDAMRKDPSRHSKLEKADILEMAVKHLRSVHRHHSAMQDDLDKYRAGFNECASEVEKYSGLDMSVRRRLVQHLNNHFSAANMGSSRPLTPNELAGNGAHLPNQHQILNPQSINAAALNGFLFSANANAAGVQLVPTRLPNGELALILPSVSASNNIQQRLAMSPSPSPSSLSCSTPPLANMINHSRSTSMDSVISNNSPIAFDGLSVNIPPSSSSMEDICHSPGSVQSNYSSSRSPASMYNSYDRLYHSPKPLSLVVREDEKQCDKQCWRPW